MSKRVATFSGLAVVMILFMILAGRIVVSEAFPPVLFLLAVIPRFVILIATIVLAPLVLFAFRESKVMKVAWSILVAAQVIILAVRTMGWTAESWFVNGAETTGTVIIDPRVEQYVMIVFWVMVAVAMAVALEQILNSFRKTGPRFDVQWKLIAVVLCEMFVLGLIAFGRLDLVGLAGRQNVSSISPTRTREIQLLPMSANIDINGVVIQREGRSILWRSVGRVGDILTVSKGARFTWVEQDSKAFLLLEMSDKEYPALGFDFTTHQSIDTKLSHPELQDY